MRVSKTTMGDDEFDYYNATPLEANTSKVVVKVSVHLLIRPLALGLWFLKRQGMSESEKTKAKNQRSKTNPT